MSSSVIAQCGNDNHEHLTGTGHDGEPLGHLEPMICSHCKRPAHYDFGIEDYRHDEDASCFLMESRASSCQPA